MKKPVWIDPSVEYVVSVYNAYDGFGFTPTYFTSPYSNGPLHAPVNAGVQKAATGETFPDQQTSTNYWVDPMIAAEASLSFNVMVDPNMIFSVGSHAGACNGVAQTAGSTSGPTTAALHASASTNAVVAQDLQVSTNAASGYSVYGRATGTLSDGNGHAIAHLGGGLTNAQPGAFSAAGTSSLGYTTNDTSLTATGDGANRFTNGGAKWAPFSTSNAEVAFASAGPVLETTCVAYQVGISAAQASGQYTTSIVYTAVPTF